MKAKIKTEGSRRICRLVNGFDLVVLLGLLVNILVVLHLLYFYFL